MFFSSFQINPVRRGAQRLLASPHALHAAVLAGFPDPAATSEGRVLWRLDNREHDVRLFIVSPTQPDMTHLAEQAGWPSLPETWDAKPYGKLLDRVTEGQTYHFRLTANPTRSTRAQHGERGKPRGHVTVTQQEQWLLDRQDQHGFAIGSRQVTDGEPSHALSVRDRKLLVFHRRETKVTLRVVTYEGSLMVRDRDAFVAALCNGIGRAKGYGCGLLTVAPTR